MPIIKQYSQVEAESLIKNYEENAKLDLVGLYPSARKFVEQLILAHDVAEKKSFDADIDYKALSPKKDKYRYGFITNFDSKEKAFVYSFPNEKGNFDWAVDMFEKCVERLDIDKITEWHKKMYYTDEVQEEIKIMLDYYNRTGYFQNYIKKIAQEKPLTEEQYIKFTKNKYATKIIAGHWAEPEFAVGEIVLLRGDTAYAKRQGCDKGLVVISNKEPIINAKKGNKRYKLLPIGSSRILYRDECELKSHKRKRKKK